MAANKNDGPCPPVKQTDEGDEKDNRLAEVTEADFSAEESKEESA